MLEVAADWYELMIPHRTMRPSILPASANNWTRAASRHTTVPSATLASIYRPSPHKLILISHPTERRGLIADTTKHCTECIGPT